MRTTVLDGLAHAVKTPLMTIVAPSSGLREIGSLSPLQDELALLIESQASYFSDLTGKLLRTAKLEFDDLFVKTGPVLLYDMFGRALEELRTVYNVGRVALDVSDTNRTIDTDPELLHMVITQVLENALKYSTEHSKVAVCIVAP